MIEASATTATAHGSKWTPATVEHRDATVVP